MKIFITNNLVIILLFLVLLLINVSIIYNLYLKEIKRTMYIDTKMYEVLYQVYKDTKKNNLDKYDYKFYVQENNVTYEIINSNKIKKSNFPIPIKEHKLEEFENYYVFRSDNVFIVHDKKHNLKSEIVFNNNNYKISNFNSFLFLLVGAFLFIIIMIVFNITKKYDKFLLSDKISDTINTFRNTSFIVSNFSHEINTPLISIEKNMYVLEQVLKKNNYKFLKDEIKIIDAINNDILFIKNFMSKILTFKLISEDNYSSKSLYYYLNIIKDTLRNTTTTKLDINIDKNFKKYNVTIPREYLYSIFMNMFKNSYEADSSKIDVTIIKMVNNKLYVKYEDNGVGILKKPPSDIFKSSISTKSNKRGFGMYFVKTIIKSSGGDIRITKTDSSGTVFELIIPVKIIQHR